MYTEEQVSWMLDRSELYAEHNRQNPGFFDMFINSGQCFSLFCRYPSSLHFDKRAGVVCLLCTRP